MYTLGAYLYKLESARWSFKGCLLLLAGAFQPKLDAAAFLTANLLAPCTPYVCITVVEDDMPGQVAQLLKIAIWDGGNRDMFRSVWEGAQHHRKSFLYSFN